MNNISLKEFIDVYVFDAENQFNSSLHSLMGDPGFIFKEIRERLTATNIFPTLTSYLNGKISNSFGWNATHLDELLYTSYGQRLVNSFMLIQMQTPNGTDRTWAQAKSDISKNIIMKFGQRWEEYILELAIDYNPVANYDMTEHEEVNSSVTVSGNNAHSLQGFNSLTYKPESKDEDTHTTSGDKKDNYRDLTRSGNIGVTTSQQMLESEIKLRDENILIERLLLDVANFITVGVYV